jgi:hypothetical protein
MSSCDLGGAAGARRPISSKNCQNTVQTLVIDIDGFVVKMTKLKLKNNKGSKKSLQKGILTDEGKNKQIFKTFNVIKYEKYDNFAMISLGNGQNTIQTLVIRFCCQTAQIALASEVMPYHFGIVSATSFQKFKSHPRTTSEAKISVFIWFTVDLQGLQPQSQKVQTLTCPIIILGT